MMMWKGFIMANNKQKKVSYAKYIKPYLLAFILGPLFMLIEVLGEVVMPKLLALIIDEGVNNERGTGYVIFIGVCMVLMALFMMVGGVLGAYFAIKASTKFANDLRKDIFAKVQKFSFANIDKFSTGSLVTRLTNDITQIQNFIAMILRMALRAPGMMIGAIIMALAINAKLASVVIAVIPFLIIVIGVILKFGYPKFKAMQSKLDSLNNSSQEGLTNIRVVKSFVREGFQTEKFETANKDLRDTSLSALHIMVVVMPAMTFVMNATVLAIVWFGGNQIINNTGMTVGNLSSFITYVMQILMSLMMTSMIFLSSSRVMASSKRIKDVLAEEVDLTDDDAKCKDSEVSDGSIEFNNVNFKYYKNNEEWVLENLNFKIESGETVGIIGSTGSGKTSLVNLIPRLYDTDEGEVLVGGINVKDYSLTKLRDAVSCVLQKNLLFSGTIAENLRWGNEEATDEELKTAAKYAQADSFVSNFADGYDMELGQGGVNVSGGQKQRLCIARALLKKPKVLILDDSTSAVDTATEANIRKAFKDQLEDVTKIIIAQRISSVMDSDKIIVMDEGKIMGIGTHDELIKSCETYQEIYYSQVDKEVTA